MLTHEILIPKHTHVNGIDLEYFDSEDDKCRDDIIVLVHGTSGSVQSHFGFLFPILAAKQRVIGVNWTPVGGESELELNDLAAQVSAVISQVAPGRKVILLGYSLGAVVAAVVAAQRVDLVERLILVAGWMRTDMQQLLRNDVWLSLRNSAVESGDDAALRAYSIFCAFGGPHLAAQTRDSLEPAMKAMRFEAFGDAQMDLNRRIDITELAHTISVPTLVIGCTHDQMVPVRHQQALFGAIEDSRYAEIPTGHAVVFERPSELTHYVQRFVDEPFEHAAGTIISAARP